MEARLTDDGRGRGLFASRKIKKGEFLIVEKAFAHANNCKLDQQQALHMQMMLKFDGKERNLHLACDLLKKMRSKKRWTAQALQLFHGKESGLSNVDDVKLLNERFASHETFAESGLLDKTYNLTPEAVTKLVSSNVFGSQDCMLQVQASLDPEVYAAAEKDFVSALYMMTSLLNHSCLSNSNFYFIGDYIFVLACSDIDEGEEILVSYYLQTQPFRERQKTFVGLGFTCKCDLCQKEMWLIDKYLKLPKEEQLPPIDNSYPKPDIPIKIYADKKEEFFEDLIACDGYINELFYLSKQSLVGQIMTQKNNKDLTTDAIIEFYNEVFEPIKFSYFGRLSIIKFLISMTTQFNKKNKQLADFLKKELKIYVAELMSGKPDDKLTNYIFKM